MDTINATSTLSSPIVQLDWTWQNACKLIMAAVGICGNALVIAVYNNKKKQKSSTNVLILALAFADLISSINFIPLPVLLRVPQSVWGQLYCRVVFSQAFLWISIEASVYTLTLLSVERYLAVVYPLRYRAVFTKSRPRGFVLVIWLFAIIVKSFNFYNTKIEDGGGCVYIDFAKGFNLLVAVGVAIVEYFIPIAVMIVCNGFTIMALRSQARNLQGHGGSNGRDSGPALSVLKTRRRVIHIVLIVIITFIVCWTPDQISLLLMNLNVLSIDHFNSDTHQAFIILAFFNSCANPIIYTFKNNHFRASLLTLFRCRSGRVSAGMNVDTDMGPTAMAGGSNHVHTVSKRTTMTVMDTVDNAGPTSVGVHSIQSAEEAS